VEQAEREPGGARGAEVAEYASFVVRLTRSAAGQVSGVVERVKTGEKVRFEGVDGVCRVIARMIGEDCAAPPP
jgi:hypothetical protein